jgi:hypothetical protein
MTFADKIIQFNGHLSYNHSLPMGFEVVNPFVLNPETLQISEAFYHKYYNDHQSRKLILGINPGRNGAGVTGIPFTDTKRLESECGIIMKSVYSHEVSSVFVYDMINAYGGPVQFYKNYFITSAFPLAIVQKNNKNEWVNANYYDDNSLFDYVKPFMITSLKTQIDFGLDVNEIYVLGKKNAQFISKLNKEASLFDRLTILEHPRYIQQYKTKQKQIYREKYLSILA